MLRQYCEMGSEEAFGELTRRHVDLVYSAARRQVGYDEQLAQEVFSALARSAGSLGKRVVIGPWSYFGTARNSRVSRGRN